MAATLDPSQIMWGDPNQRGNAFNALGEGGKIMGTGYGGFGTRNEYDLSQRAAADSYDAGRTFAGAHGLPQGPAGGAMPLTAGQHGLNSLYQMYLDKYNRGYDKRHPGSVGGMPPPPGAGGLPPGVPPPAPPIMPPDGTGTQPPPVGDPAGGQTPPGTQIPGTGPGTPPIPTSPPPVQPPTDPTRLPNALAPMVYGSPQGLPWLKHQLGQSEGQSPMVGAMQNYLQHYQPVLGTPGTMTPGAPGQNGGVIGPGQGGMFGGQQQGGTFHNILGAGGFAPGTNTGIVGPGYGGNILPKPPTLG